MVCSNDLHVAPLTKLLTDWNAAPNNIDSAYQAVRTLNRSIYKDEIGFAIFNNPGAANLRPWAYDFLRGSERAREILERVALRPDLNAEVDSFFAKFLVATNRYQLPELSRVQQQMLRGAMSASKGTDFALFSECVAVRAQMYSAVLAGMEEGEAVSLITAEAGFTASRALSAESQAVKNCSGLIASLGRYCKNDLKLAVGVLGVAITAAVVIAVIHPNSFSGSSLS